MDGLALRQWLAALDSISYYELLRVDARADHDTLRAAFHEFAASFHPDAHRWRHPNERAAVGHIYRRGTEAWRVLSDPTLRARYDEAVARGVLRPEDLIVEMDRPRSLAPPSGAKGDAGRVDFGRVDLGRLVESVHTPGARPFVLRAQELMKRGDPRQAKLQLVMAMHLDPDNPVLEAWKKQLDEETATGASDRKERSR